VVGNLSGYGSRRLGEIGGMMEEKLSAADQERQKRWQKELEIIERDERQHKERDRSRVQ